MHGDRQTDRENDKLKEAHSTTQHNNTDRMNEG